MSRQLFSVITDTDWQTALRRERRSINFVREQLIEAAKAKGAAQGLKWLEEIRAGAKAEDVRQD